MQVNCWHEVGVKGAAKDVVKLRRLSAAQTKELREAIRTARTGGEGNALVYELPRGFSDTGRAVARSLVGIGVVVVLLAGVAAFLAPSAANLFIGAGVVPGALAAGFAALFGFELDMGLRIFADGRLRREGWNGIRELDLRAYPRVTVAPRSHGDVDGIGF